MTDHSDAIHALTQRIDLLYYMRHTGDRAEMRRVVRSLVRGVRVLRTADDEDGPCQWHRAPYNNAPAMRRRKRAASEHAARMAAIPDGELLSVVRSNAAHSIANAHAASSSSGAALAIRSEYIREAHRRGLV